MLDKAFRLLLPFMFVVSNAWNQSIITGADIKNLGQQQIIKNLGQPDLKETFKMKDMGPSEFRVELLNTYPLKNPKNLNVEIQEWTWKKGEKQRTVWFHQVKGTWKALHWHDSDVDTEY